MAARRDPGYQHAPWWLLRCPDRTRYAGRAGIKKESARALLSISGNMVNNGGALSFKRAFRPLSLSHSIFLLFMRSMLPGIVPASRGDFAIIPLRLFMIRFVLILRQYKNFLLCILFGPSF